jgi:hypothetical protein
VSLAAAAAAAAEIAKLEGDGSTAKEAALGMAPPPRSAGDSAMGGSAMGGAVLKAIEVFLFFFFFFNHIVFLFKCSVYLILSV